MFKVLYGHNNTINKQTQEDLFNKYVPLTLFVTFERVVCGFMVRGSWRPNRTAIYWPLLLLPSALCLSRSPGLLNRRPRDPLYWVRAFSTASCHQRVSKHHRGSQGPLRPGVAFPTTSYQQLLWTPTQSGAPRAPSAWCGFPYHISSLTSCLDWVI